MAVEVMIRLLAMALILFTQTANAKPSPEMAGTLSIIPGLGQVSNGDTLEGLGWFVTSIGLYASGNTHVSNVGFKIWSYNMYDAYKDGGGSQTAKYNVFQNYIAAFNPLNLIDPYSVGMIGYGAVSATTTPGSKKAKLGPKSAAQGAVFFAFTGLGEEALFRGFLYPAFSKSFNSHFAGATLSSALFSASHLTNKNAFYHSARGLGLLFIWGMLWCAQTSYNNYDLRHSIFSHAWFDFMIEYAGDPATGNSAPPMGLKVTIPLP